MRVAGTSGRSARHYGGNDVLAGMLTTDEPMTDEAVRAARQRARARRYTETPFGSQSFTRGPGARQATS